MRDALVEALARMDELVVEVSAQRDEMRALLAEARRRAVARPRSGAYRHEHPWCLHCGGVPAAVPEDGQPVDVAHRPGCWVHRVDAALGGDP